MNLFDRMARSIVVFSTVLLFSETATSQRIVHVPSDVATIQGGINAANDGDIVLVAPGTYNENINFNGKAITVSSGAKSFEDAASTFINGTGSGFTVIFNSKETSKSILNGFTIQNGTLTAVYLPGTSPTVSNNIITNNIGCAIVVTGVNASPIIAGNKISHTIATGHGDCGVPVVLSAGFASAGTGINLITGGDIQVIGNTIEANVSTLGGGACGAGLLAEAVDKLLLLNNIVRDNHSLCNGGFYLRNVGALSLIQNVVYNNIVDGGGAGGGPGVVIQHEPSYAAPTVLTMTNNTLYGNVQTGESYTGIPGQASQASFVGKFESSHIENNLFVGSDDIETVSCVGTTGSTITFANNDFFHAGPQLALGSCLSSNATLGNKTVDPNFINPVIGDFHTLPFSPVVATGDINAPLIPSADLDQKARTVCGTIDMGVYEVRPHPPIALTASPNPTPGRSTVTLAAMLRGNCNVPTGLVTLLDGSTILGTASVDKGGLATFTTSSLSVGTHIIMASYPGDFNFEDSTSNSITVVITGPPSITILNSVTPNPARPLQAITMTATVSSAYTAPTGTITFIAGGKVLATSSIAANGSASAAISTLGAGSYTITAVYNGSAEYAASTSNAIVETVLGADTITSLTAAPNPIAPGQTVTFTAKVASSVAASQFDGTVTFKDGAATLGASGIEPNGLTAFSTAALATGTHSITAVYGGSLDFNGSISAPMLLVVTAIPTSLGLNVSPNPASIRQNVTLIATSVANLSNQAPLGTVTFSDQFGVLGTTPLVAGVASLSTTTLSVGTHAIAAALNPAGSFAGSISNTVSEVINDFDFSVVVAPSILVIPRGNYQILNVTITPSGGFPRGVNLSCSSLPAHAQCSFDPTVTQPLSDGTQTVKLLLNTSDVLGYGDRVGKLIEGKDRSPRSRWPSWATLFLPFMALCGFRGGASRRSRITKRHLLLLVSISIGGLNLVACSGKLPSSTSPGHYIIHLTASDSNTSTGLLHSTDLVLQVTE